MKTNRFSLKYLFLLTLLLMFGFALWEGTHAAAKDTSQGVQVYTFSSQQAKGISASIQSVEVSKADVQVILCIEMPTLAPWNPYATLMVDGKTIPNTEVALLNAKSPSVMKSANRCYRFAFPISAEGNISKTATLHLEKLWLEVGNGQLDENAVAEIENRLQEIAPGVEFEVVTQIEKGGGGAFIRILTRPDGMSEQQAIEKVLQASIEEIPLYWQAEIPLN